MKEPAKIIGRSELVNFPEQGLLSVAARIDTGAKTSSIWASNIVETDGQLRFTLFDTASDHYTGTVYEARNYALKVVASSNGISEERYVVKLLLVLAGRKIRARFTLANRSAQAYPVLVGRNVLRGKFLVDVTRGQPLLDQERKRSKVLQSQLRDRKEQA